MIHPGLDRQLLNTTQAGGIRAKFPNVAVKAERLPNQPRRIGGPTVERSVVGTHNVRSISLSRPPTDYSRRTTTQCKSIRRCWCEARRREPKDPITASAPRYPKVGERGYPRYRNCRECSPNGSTTEVHCRGDDGRVVSRHANTVGVAYLDNRLHSKRLASLTTRRLGLDHQLGRYLSGATVVGRIGAAVTAGTEQDQGGELSEVGGSET